MIYIIFDHDARAWIGNGSRPVASIFDAKQFTKQEGERLLKVKRARDLELCEWAGE